MSSIIRGVLTDGVVVPNSPLPEGANVEIQLKPSKPEAAQVIPTRLTPGELRKMPREQRQAVLAAAAELAEQDYREGEDLTAFSAFSDEEIDGDESESR